MLNLKSLYSKSLNIITHKISKNYIYQIFFAMLFGVMLTFAFSPFDDILFVPVSIIGFISLINIRTQKKKQSRIYIQKFIIGMSYGFAHFITGLYWVSNSISLVNQDNIYNWLIPATIFGIPFLMSLFTGLLAVLSFFILLKSKVYNDKINKALNSVIFSILFSLSWVVIEYLRSYTVLPFPWLLIGYGANFSLAFMQSAFIFTVWGLGFLLVFISSLLYTRNVQVFFIALTIIIGNFIYGNYRLNLPNDEIDFNYVFRVVQPNTVFDFENPFRHRDRILKILSAAKISEFVEKYQNKNLYLIFPENAITFPLLYLPNNETKSILIDFIYDEMKKIHKSSVDKVSLISGIDIIEWNEQLNVDEIFNSIIAINNKKVIWHYNKRILVPFGEYIPWRVLLNKIPLVTNQGDTDFAFGSKKQSNLDLNAGNKKLSLAPFICYEIVFPRPFAYQNVKDAQILLNITNDIWFGDSIGPYQHLAMARMRAIEYSKPLIRVANSGISSYIDSKGRIKKRLDLNKEGIFDILY